MAAVIAALGGNYETVSVTAPLGGKLQAHVGHQSQGRKIALIESAEVIGLQTLWNLVTRPPAIALLWFRPMVLAACRQGVKNLPDPWR